MTKKTYTKKQLKELFWIKERWNIDAIKNYFEDLDEALEVFTTLFIHIEEKRNREKGLRSRDKKLMDSLHNLTKKKTKLNLDPYYMRRAPVKWKQENLLIDDMIKINKKYMNLSKPDLSKFLWTNFQTNMTQGAILRFIQQVIKDQKDNK